MAGLFSSVSSMSTINDSSNCSASRGLSAHGRRSRIRENNPEFLAETRFPSTLPLNKDLADGLQFTTISLKKTKMM